ncbi:acyl-CoA dehydrogenase family protein [Marinicella meishanensis]|uniref:acyl-CoA dehydrogenase family protein n=1 Tax=Marinicella meishanensis TaxID=2873263 RepID=UPI001CBAEF00|nr:acyl-CoA dehydrogenase family protein [Marinicella sp. NBU2979]
MPDTHQVKNQPLPLHNHNLYLSDPQLQHWLSCYGGDWGAKSVSRLGATLGQEAWIERGFLANQLTPELHTHDTRGHRRDLVKYHPAYHELMALAIKHNIHALPWQQPEPGAHLVRLAKNYCHNQNEAGSACPLTMTFACVPSLQQSAALSQHWIPKVWSSQYDPSNRPMQDKTGLTIGMAMTEKQGGTDVRANTSRASHQGSGAWGERYALTGHKWFCSAPMSDAFLTLAQTDQGLGCFLLPRWQLDQNKNRVHIQRLKNKLGNRANASSEIEFEQAEAWLIGEPGRGVATIIQMVALTRYDCMIGSTALMRQALAQVVNHISQRQVMGQLLIDQALMQNVVVDLALDWVGALALTARMAQALDHSDQPTEQHLIRLLTSVGKFWICKQAMAVTAEAAECLGGAGYIEDHINARLFREAPVNSIWEGSGNVQCLDVIRALQKSPEVWPTLTQLLQQAAGQHAGFDRSLSQFLEDSDIQQLQPFAARHWVSRLAVLTQAALLLQHGHPEWAQAYCDARLESAVFGPYGQLPRSVDTDDLIRKILLL